MDTPHVYACIAAVSTEIAATGISKSRSNAQQGYKFRGIDDVYNALAPLISKHGLVIIPRILSRELVEREAKSGGTLHYVTVEAEFDFVSVKDGSKVTARSFGEAMDSADKATNKAMSAAYKYTAFQTFCIPTEGDNDADAHTPEPQARAAQPVRSAPAPVQQPSHSGEVRVTNAKVAKRGQNDKGPWTLYAVKFSDGREATTFSQSLYDAADEACRDGRLVEPEINGKKLVGMMPVYRDEEVAQ
jgi:hypothetical protein